MQSDAFGITFSPHTHPIALHVDDVHEEDTATRLGKGRREREADIAGAEHCDLCHGPRLLPERLQALGDRQS